MFDDSETTVGGLPMFARTTAVEPASRVCEAVLVPGLGLSGRYLEPAAIALAPRLRTHVVDLPGFGRSGRPPRALDTGELAAALAAWLDAREIERPLLYGNSYGSQVVAELAATRPGRPWRVGLGAPTPDPHHASFRRYVPRLALAGLRAPQELRRIAARDYLRAGLPRVWRTGRHALGQPIRERLSAIAAPALVVHGEDDPLVPDAWAEEVVRLLPHGRLVIVPGDAHGLPFKDPGRLAELLGEWVAERV